MLGYKEAEKLEGRTVVSADGETLGRFEDAYVDHETHQAEWALVTADALGRTQFLVPLRDAEVAKETVTVAYSAQAVRSQPVIDAEGEITAEEEADLYEHYGMVDTHEHLFDDGIPRDGLEPWPHIRRIADMGRILNPREPYEEPNLPGHEEGLEE